MKWIVSLFALIGDYLNPDEDDWLEELFSGSA